MSNRKSWIKIQSFFKKQFFDIRRIASDPVLLITIVFVLFSLILFILLPLYKVLAQSLFNTKGIFSLSGYIRAFTSTENIRTIGNTLLLGLVVGAASTLVGFLFAFCGAYLRMAGKKIFSLIVLLPIISPPFAVAFSVIVLFGNRGLITYSLFHLPNSNIYGFTGLVFVQALSFFPIAYLLLDGVLRNIDSSMEEASRNLGGSRWKTFARVTFPLALPAIANSFILVFIKSVVDFGSPIAIGGNYTTLATQIYLQSIGNYDIQGGTAIAMILLNICIVLFVLSKYWLEKKVAVTVSGKASRERVLISENHIVWPLAGISLLISFVIIIFYIFIPIVSFTKLWGINYSFTLDHYKYAMAVGGKAIWDTVWLSVVATPIAGIIGMIVAFLIVRKRFIGRGLMDFTSMLSIAVPGTVIGIGYILAFNSRPIVLTGTAAIIIIAFIARAIPIGIRSGVSSLQQIDPSIEEAGSDLGANSFQVFTTITLPLIKNAFFSGLLYTFVRSITALSAVIFLISAQYHLLTIAILDQIESGRFGVASAYSTIMIVVVYAAIFLMYRLLALIGVNHDDIKLA